MPWNILLLPLLSGYYIITNSYLFKFKHQRLDSQILIFQSILYGLIIFIFTYSLRFIISDNIINYLYQFIPLKIYLLGTSVFTLLFSIILTHLINLFLEEDKFISKAIEEKGNEMEIIINSAFINNTLIEIILNNNTVYTAWIKELPIPNKTNYITLIPTISGYKNNENNIIYNKNYLSIIKNNPNCSVIINISDISYLSNFIYNNNYII